MFPNYEWLLLLFPLIGVIINGLFGHRLPRRVVAWIGCLAVGLSFLVALSLLWAQLRMPAEAAASQSTLYQWISAGAFKIDATLLIDPLSVLMAVVVTGVSLLIHVYSVGYMAEDPHYSRYFTFLNLFVFSMLTLVMGSNFLMMYVGWEAVGLCSYLLIGFWFEKPSAANAGKKAFLVNRVGDFGFALGIMLIFATFGTLDFATVFQKAAQLLPVGGGVVTAITLLLFMGAVGKSAQIPLYVWLPDAMEGPTPVSALIHAATMVTAGVYMVSRTHVLFDRAPWTMGLVAIVGVLTAFFAATMALTENDMKRVLAYSTISQLGYMFVAVGVGAYAAGMFHLTTHAFFKALLFLGAGSVMHALSGELDIRKMGGLKDKMPTTFLTMVVGGAALAGVPVFSGFFSKDDILWQAWENGGLLLWLVGAVTAFMTAFYTFRLIFLAFWGESHEKMGKAQAAHVHESPSVMTTPLVILAVFAALAGFIGVPGGLSLVEPYLHPALATPGVIRVAEANPLEWVLLAVSVIIALSGIWLAYYMYVLKPSVPKALAKRYEWLYTVLQNKYYVDRAYMEVVVKPLRDLGAFAGSVLDRGVVDAIVNGVGSFTVGSGGVLGRLQAGFVREYALSILLGVAVILGYLVLR
jgi:NADH-quinone oxidoreductase subunit L